MLISKIQKLKNNKYKIIIDGEQLITYDNVILENNLLYKKVIDIDLYNKILKDTDYYNIYNKVVKYILKRKRSEKEVRDYLNKTNSDDMVIDSIINKLKGVNLINDTSFCKSFINDNIYLGKSGINKIKKDLLDQNISINEIESEFNNIDIAILDERLLKLITKKIRSNKKYSTNFLKQKILNEMINLGYERDKVNNILNESLVEDESIIESEFEKLYVKLHTKYSEKQIYNKIKQKLISKGFYIDDINKLIEKKQKI